MVGITILDTQTWSKELEVIWEPPSHYSMIVRQKAPTSRYCSHSALSWPEPTWSSVLASVRSPVTTTAAGRTCRRSSPTDTNNTA